MGKKNSVQIVDKKIREIGSPFLALLMNFLMAYLILMQSFGKLLFRY